MTQSSGHVSTDNSLQILRYIARHRQALLLASQALGVQPSSVSGAVGEEFRVYLENPSLQKTLDGTWANQMVLHAGFPNAQAEIDYWYSQDAPYLQQGTRRPLAGTDGNSIVNAAIGLAANDPLENDTGVGNINFGYAVYVVRKYRLNRPDDPLGLRQYDGNEAQLYKDMNDPNSDTFIKVAALIVKDCQDYYLNNPDPRIRDIYLQASQQQRDYLIDLRYRNSPDTTAKIVLSGNPYGSQRPGYYDFFQSPYSPYKMMQAVINGTFNPNDRHFNYAAVLSPASYDARTATQFFGSYANSVFIDYNYLQSQGIPTPPDIQLGADQNSDSPVIYVIGRATVAVFSNGSKLSAWKITNNSYLAAVRNDGHIIFTAEINNSSAYYSYFDGNGILNVINAANPSKSAYIYQTSAYSSKVVIGSKSVTFGQGARFRTNGDGTITVEKIIPNSDGSVATDAKGNDLYTPVATISVDGNNTLAVNPLIPRQEYRIDNENSLTLSGSAQYYGGIGGAIGSALGDFFAHGNQLEGVVYSTLLGQIGKGVAIGLLQGWNSADSAQFWNGTNANVLDNFQGGLGAGLLSAGAGVISSVLALDLANQLGIKGFGAELVSTVVSADTSAVVVQVINNLNHGISAFGGGFDGLSNFGSHGELAPTTNFRSVTLNAIGSFLGAKLGSLIVQPHTQAAALLSSVLSAVDSYIYATQFATIGSSLGPVGAFVGAFVGYVWGTLIGNLIGRKKPKIPSAGAETVLDLPYAQYRLGSVVSTNGGATDLVKEMAGAAAQTLNGIISQITGEVKAHFVSNSYSPSQTYGYTGNQLYVKLGGIQYNVTSADQAVDKGVLWALPQTQIIGGDLFVKRAIRNSNASDIVDILGDIQSAKDYGYYSVNRNIIKGYIESAYSTLTAEEQNFYANNRDLVNKIDKTGETGLSSSEQNLFNSNKAKIYNIISAVQSQSAANPWIITLERANELGLNNWSSSDFYGGLQGFLQSFGMGRIDASASYGDVRLGWDGYNLTVTDTASPGLFSVLSQASADGTSVTINNFNGVMSGSAQVGWNILIGGNGGNNLFASSADTWIQGGAGTDTLHGGGGKDVIIAGAGNTTIYGGNGDSYMAAGAGSDSVYAGGGENTIAAGSGTANLYGGSNGNTTYIGYQGGQWVWFWAYGSNNTASFERWTSGVNIDLGAYYGFSWAPTAVVYQNVGLQDIQNLIGSAAGGNTLKTGGSGGVLEGGAGNDTFIGVFGGTTAVTFANSGAGVYVDLATGVSFGGSSNGDVFTNIKNVTGSGFDDELKGVAGSTLNGGTGGNDWFDFSGGGNSYIGSVDGFNTVDYSQVSGYTTVTLAGNSGQSYLASGQVDNLTNISQIVGGRGGTEFSDFQLNSTPLNSRFVPGGGYNEIYGNTVDTVELDFGGGQTQSYIDIKNFVFGSGVTYDNIWASYTTYSTTTETRFWDYDYSWNDYDTTTSSNSTAWTFGIRGTNDSVSAIWGLPSISMDGASTLEMNVNFLVGPSTEDSGYSYTFAQDYYGTYDINNWWDNITTTANGSLGSNISGTNYGGSLIIAGGGASYINVDNGATTSNGSVVIAGQAATSGLVINTSSGDDQFTFERGDGHYTIYGTGGQKTIDFGPSVGANDVIYNVVGNDLYIGVQDLNNPALTSDQVSDNIRIINGAIKYVYDSGNPTWPNQYFIQVGGSSIDLTKLSINWVQQHVSGQGAPPIVFDLNNDGLELTPVAKSDVVTRNADGVITRMGWVGPTNGILVADHNHDGKIDSLSDISFINDKAGATTDLEGLAGWDSNGDGVINSHDAGWSQLKMWVDANVDGQAEAGEVKSLEDLGIAAVHLNGKATGNTAADSSDSYVTATTTFDRVNGTVGHAYDVTLRRQFLGAAALEDIAGMTWASVGSEGQIGQMLTSPGRFGGEGSYADFVAQGNYNFTGSGTTSIAAAALWSDFLDPVKDAARKTQLATGHIGDTTSLRDTAVQTQYANRGAHHQTQRMQVLDLDFTGEGAKTVDAASSGVKQDVDLTGNPYSIGWVGANDGLLVIDAVRDSNIDAPTEATFQNWLPRAKTSLEGLAAFDTNADGAIDAGDKVFDNLRIWTDSNGDGVSQTAELKSLSELGVKSISLTADSSNPDHKILADNEILTTSTVTMTDGTTHLMYDIALGVNTGKDASAADTQTAPAADNQVKATPNLPSVSDASASAASTSTPNDSLKTQLDSSTSGVATQSAGSTGPSGEVVTADPANSSTASGWWDSNSGQSLSDAINVFHAAAASDANTQAPVASANDAAMIQRHLFLRQVIAGFTVHGSAPAVFARQGGLDTQATLAAAVTAASAAKPTSSVTGVAA